MRKNGLLTAACAAFFLFSIIIAFWFPYQQPYYWVHVPLLGISFLSAMAIVKLNESRLAPLRLGIIFPWIAAVSLLLLALFGWLSYDYLKGIPDYLGCPWPDPGAYLMQAKMMAAGHLSAPSPQLPEFFNEDCCLNYHGRFFGKYPPGWPALLAIGLKSGLPWLMNPILTVAGLLMVYAFARKFFDPTTAIIAFVFASTSDIVMWACKNYFSEPLAFLSMTFFVFCSLCALKEVSRAWSIAAGISLGALFLAHPSTAIAICIPVACFWIIASIRDRTHIIHGIFLIAGAFPLFILHFLYNQNLTGSPFTLPHSLFCAYDRLGFGLRAPGNRFPPTYYGPMNVPYNIISQLKEMSATVPIAPLFISALLLKPIRKIEWFIVLAAVSFVGFHSLFHTATVRYHMPAMAIIALGCAAGITKIARWFLGAEKAGPGAFLVAMMLSFAGAVTITAPIAFYESKGQSLLMNPFLKVRAARLENAIVVLRSLPPMGYSDCYTQNAPDFSNSVLYVNDLGARDTALFALYPSRKFYYYDFDPVSAKGSLSPVFSSLP